MVQREAIEKKNKNKADFEVNYLLWRGGWGRVWRQRRLRRGGGWMLGRSWGRGRGRRRCSDLKEEGRSGRSHFEEAFGAEAGGRLGRIWNAEQSVEPGIGWQQVVDEILAQLIAFNLFGALGSRRRGHFGRHRRFGRKDGRRRWRRAVAIRMAPLMDSSSSSGQVQIHQRLGRTRVWQFRIARRRWRRWWIWPAFAHLTQVIEALGFGVHQRPVRVLRRSGTSVRLLGNWKRLRLRHGRRLDRQLRYVRRFRLDKRRGSQLARLLNRTLRRVGLNVKGFRRRENQRRRSRTSLPDIVMLLPSYSTRTRRNYED